MAKTPEQEVQDPIIQFLINKDAWFIKHKAGSNKVGVPDILCCYGGYFIAIEVKRKSGGKVSARQKFNLNHISENGGIGISANSLDIVKDVFDIIENPTSYRKSDIVHTKMVNGGLGLNSKPEIYSKEPFYGVWNDILYYLVKD